MGRREGEGGGGEREVPFNISVCSNACNCPQKMFVAIGRSDLTFDSGHLNIMTLCHMNSLASQLQCFPRLVPRECSSMLLR